MLPVPTCTHTPSTPTISTAVAFCEGLFAACLPDFAEGAHAGLRPRSRSITSARPPIMLSLPVVRSGLARTQRGTQCEHGDGHGDEREGRDDRVGDLVAGQVGIHEDDRSDHEGYHAAHAEHAETRRERLGRQQSDPDDQERKPGIVDRQHLQRETRRAAGR